MIGRHYFRDQLVKSFDFKFSYVPPNTRNSWDVIYDVPLLEDGLVNEMLAAPYETKSDSFTLSTISLSCTTWPSIATENSIEGRERPTQGLTKHQQLAALEEECRQGV